MESKERVLAIFDEEKKTGPGYEFAFPEVESLRGRAFIDAVSTAELNDLSLDDARDTRPEQHYQHISSVLEYCMQYMSANPPSSTGWNLIHDEITRLFREVHTLSIKPF